MKTKQPLVWAMFAVVAIVVVGLVVILASAPATAGGATWLEADREFYRPGQTVRLAQERVPKASREWRGPYRITLVRWPEGDAPGGGARLIGVPDIAEPIRRYVGDLRVERWSDEFVRVSLTFTLPRVPDGMYSLETCNPGCTENLELAGNVFVGHAPPAWALPAGPPAPVPLSPPPPETTTTVGLTTTVIVTPPPAPAVLTGGSPEEIRALGPRPDSGRDLSTVEWGILVGFGTAIVAWAFLGNGELLDRRRRRRVRK